MAANDTFTIKGGGTLVVDTSPSAVIGTINIGDATTPGNVVFWAVSVANPSTPTVRTLKVKDIVMSGVNGNLLDMSYLHPSVQHQLQVSGNFLTTSTAKGNFYAGAGTVEYNGTSSQAVQATIAGGGTSIYYRDLKLSGSPSSGNAAKTFANGTVNVQGTLTITGKAQITENTSANISYGSSSSLTYDTSSAQKTLTSIELTAAPIVTVSGANGVILGSSDLTLNGGTMTIPSGSVLSDNGKSFILAGAAKLINNGTHNGTGAIKTTGTSTPTLDGSGNYGNVWIAGNAQTLAGSTFSILGRLSFDTGKTLNLANTADISVRYLFFGNWPSAITKQATGTWGNTGSGAANINATFFAGTKLIDVKAQLKAKFVSLAASPASIAYGSSPVTVSGTITGVDSVTGNAATFGSPAAQAGQTVKVTLNSVPPAVYNGPSTSSSGTFSQALAVNTLAINTYSVTFEYAGDTILAAASADNSLTFAVTPVPMTITPLDHNKYFGQVDPSMGTLGVDFTTTDSLMPGDKFVGSLARAVTTEAIGAYIIGAGTLKIHDASDNDVSANYTLTVLGGHTLTILPRPITVNPVVGQNRVYDGQGVAGDATLTYTVDCLGTTYDYAHRNDALAPGMGHSFVNALTRDPGKNVSASYVIRQGTLTIDAAPSDPTVAANYAITVNPATYAITKRTVTILPNSGQSKTYGQNDPTITGSYVEAVTPTTTGDTDVSYKLGRETGEIYKSAGYKILQGSTWNGGQNWTLALSGTSVYFMINKANLTIGTVGNLSKTYNAVQVTRDTLLTYSGLANGDTAPTTKPTVTFTPGGATGPVNQGSYTYAVTQNAADNNYTIGYNISPNNTISIGKRPITVVAENKTKVYDGYPYTGFTKTIDPAQYVGGSTDATVFGGSWVPTGAAVTATATGVYAQSIDFTGWSVIDNNYSATVTKGKLVITGPISTQTASTLAWADGGKVDFQIKNAACPTATGTPGTDWSYTVVSGALTIANPAAITVNLVSLLNDGSSANGKAANFDPTRAQSWKFLKAGSIANFATATFVFNLDNFKNPLFGTYSFSVTKAADGAGEALFIVYTPQAQPAPTGFDVTTVVNGVKASDVPLLYLDAVQSGGGNYVYSPIDPVHLNLRIANLGSTHVQQAQAFLRFNKTVFETSNADPATAPIVEAGDGTWNSPVVTLVSDGDMDVVMGISLESLLNGGTTADGIVAKITLHPTRFSTTTSRVYFRPDAAANPDYNGITALVTVGNAFIYPARVESQDLVINDNGSTGPHIDSWTATEVQPHRATAVNVTLSTETVVQGTVNLNVKVTDNGTGLRYIPAVTVWQGATQIDTLTGSGTIPLPPTQGSFNYAWTVGAGLATGTYTIKIDAQDYKGQHSTQQFNVKLNVNQITGVVELENFKGATRDVTLQAGVESPSAGGTAKTLTLDFVSKRFIAGSIGDLASFDQELAVPTQNVSYYLSFGDITNLNLFVTKFRASSELSLFLQGILSGTFNLAGDSKVLVAQLGGGTRSIDIWMRTQLSSDTANAMSAYYAAASPISPSITAAVSNNLTIDFNKIINTYVTGNGIYDSVRFLGITLQADTQTLLNKAGKTIDEIADLNRYLLRDAYTLTTVQYFSFDSTIMARTWWMVYNHPAGAPATTKAYLVGDLDEIARKAVSLYTPTRFAGVTLRKVTSDLVASAPSAPAPLLQLNRLLLEDFYAISVTYPSTIVYNYMGAPIGYNAWVALVNYQAAPTDANLRKAFDAAIRPDLDALITSGQLIYTPDRFAAFEFYMTDDIIAQLPPNPVPTGEALVRLNRQLLEVAFTQWTASPQNEMIRKGGIASYTLVAVPDGANKIIAKTSHSLRKDITGFSLVGNTATANFCNNGVPGWQADPSTVPATGDYYLRGGDLDGNNSVNALDYSTLRSSSLPPLTAAKLLAADINGDGSVDSADYDILAGNFFKTGDSGF